MHVNLSSNFYWICCIFLFLVPNDMLIMIFHTHISLSVHPPPAFGSSPNLGALVLEASRQDVQDGDSDANSAHLPRFCANPVILLILSHDSCFFCKINKTNMLKVL